MQTKVLVLIGPPGSGKGTQAEIVSKKLSLRVIVMGRLLRNEVNKKTALGRSLSAIMKQGALVPDQLTVKLLMKDLKTKPSKSRILFDGFPRSLKQARILDTIVDVDKVIHISLPQSHSVKRIAGRLICPKGHVYNRYYVTPKKQGICDIDSLELIRRSDESIETVRKRLQVYKVTTAKVLDYYRKQDKLFTIDGKHSVKNVTASLLKVIKEV